MSESNNSNDKSDSKSIYDITHKIEEELTYIYEMRMKQIINTSESVNKVSEKINSGNSRSANQTISLFSR